MSKSEVDEIVRVATKHYSDMVSGDWDGWLSTIDPVISRLADVRGSSIDFWWRAGRKMAEKGVTYRFQRVDYVENNRAKLFFLRLDKDGKQMGLPVPVHLMKKNGRWWVVQPTY